MHKKAARLAAFAQAQSPLHHTFRGFMAVVLQALFMSPHLSIQLIDQVVNGSVQIFIRTLGKQLIALDPNAAFGPLSSLFFLQVFYGQQHFDVHQLIKMPANSIQLGRDITSQRRGNFQMMTADRQIQE
jgi:hypothetical protein